MFYFILDFYYDVRMNDGHLSKSNFGDAESSLANILAGELVVQTLKDNNIEYRHAYAWPDGSLYEYVRLPNNNASHLRDLFGGYRNVDRDGMSFEVCVQLGNISSVDEKKIEKFDQTSVQERFDLDRGAFLATRKARSDYYEKVIMKEYHSARDACSTCRPGNLACESCAAILASCYKAADKWYNEGCPI